MYKIQISNSTDKNFNLILPHYGENRYYEDIIIPAYALNYEVSFTSEEEYKRWADMYSDYFNGIDAILKLGKSNANTLEKINKEVEKENNKKRQSNVNRIADTDKMVGVEVGIEKA